MFSPKREGGSLTTGGNGCINKLDRGNNWS